MVYNRQNIAQLSADRFDLGVHEVMISEIVKGETPRGNAQLQITVTGENGERDEVNVTFGTKYSIAELNRVLASIEDTGIAIPDLNFGNNAETGNFLLDKTARIWCKINKYLDGDGNERKNKKVEFVTLEEFEALKIKLKQKEGKKL